MKCIYCDFILDVGQVSAVIEHLKTHDVPSVTSTTNKRCVSPSTSDDDTKTKKRKENSECSLSDSESIKTVDVDLGINSVSEEEGFQEVVSRKKRKIRRKTTNIQTAKQKVKDQNDENQPDPIANQHDSIPDVEIQTRPITQDVLEEKPKQKPSPPRSDHSDSSAKPKNPNESRQAHRNNTTSSKQQTNEKAVFCQFPVIITDKKETSHSCLSGIYFRMANTLKDKIGSVLTVKKLSNEKVLIGCVDQKQQQKLLNTTIIGGITVICSIPSPTVTGVIYGVPTDITEEEIKEEISHVFDRDGNRSESIKITSVQRMRLKSGAPSRAVRLSFDTFSLPSKVILNHIELSISPFIPGIKQCYYCYRLHHKNSQCKAKMKSCSKCYMPHSGKEEDCSKEPKCINCNGDHSPFFEGCLARKTSKTAHALRCKEYMPLSTAFQKAKTIVKDQTEQVEQTKVEETETMKIPDHWREEAACYLPSPKVKRNINKITNTTNKTNIIRNDDPLTKDQDSHPMKGLQEKNRFLEEENQKLKNELSIQETQIEKLSRNVSSLIKEVQMLKSSKDVNSNEKEPNACFSIEQMKQINYMFEQCLQNRFGTMIQATTEKVIDQINMKSKFTHNG